MRACTPGKCLYVQNGTFQSHPLVHHSDRGIKYCFEKYQTLHQRYGIRSSMTDEYDCYQNALAERINVLLKTEYLL